MERWKRNECSVDFGDEGELDEAVATGDAEGDVSIDALSAQNSF